jgi:hypothetical protein
VANRETFPASPVKLTTLITFFNNDGPEDTTATITVNGLSWINTQSVIMLTFAGTTPDHEDPDDAQVEGLTAYAGNIVPGQGFDIFATAPSGTWGQYQITAIIMA